MAHVPRIYHSGAIGPGPLLVGGDNAKRLTSVMRLAPTDEVLLFPGDGKEWRASLSGAGRASVHLEVRDLHRQLPPPAVVLETWIGVIRANRFEVGLEKVVEAGADIIRPLVCEYSQRGEHASAAKLDRWRRIVVEACEQSGRLFVPEVLPPAPFERVLEAFHGPLVVAAGDGRPAAEVAPLLPVAGHLALVVGPEGGLSPAEALLLARRGALAMTLGPYILRTETAAIAGTAALRALTI